MAYHSTASHKFEEYAREELRVLTSGSNSRMVRSHWQCSEVYAENQKTKTERIAAVQGRPLRDEVHRGIRAYRNTAHPTTGASPNKLTFGRELRGKLPETCRQPGENPDNTTVHKRDGEQTEKMKKYSDKSRHTTAMRIKVGDTVLCKQENNNSPTPLFHPVPMVVIWHQGRHDHCKKQPVRIRIRIRNYADWKILKHGCRQSVTCDSSEDEDAFDPDDVQTDERLQGCRAAQ